MNTQILTVTLNFSQQGKRLDLALALAFQQFSRSRIQNWIKQGNVKLNGKVINKIRHIVFEGDEIVLDVEFVEETFVKSQAIDLDIIYEDHDILVLNKPAGLVVHPGSGNPDGTLMNGLLHYNDTLRKVPRAGIVHRLDKDTSGLMVVAKSLEAQLDLTEQLQKHSVERIYDAVVTGNVISGGTVDKPIGRHPKVRKKMAVISSGKPAKSHYRVMERFKAQSYIRVQLETGRTHQIRVHMESIGFPLFGDQVYGKRLHIPRGMDENQVDFLKSFKRQALHAGRLSLTHPITKKNHTWRIPVPDDFYTLLDVLREDIEQENCNNDDYDNGVEVEWVNELS